MAQPKYDAILNYRKFNEFINQNKRHFKVFGRRWRDGGSTNIEHCIRTWRFWILLILIMIWRKQMSMILAAAIQSGMN